jgi:hypothetical protein
MDAAAVLGVQPGATADEIHAAYRQAARRAHPDTGGDEASFRRVTEAYESLLRHRSIAAAPTVVRRRTARSQAARWVRRRISF